MKSLASMLSSLIITTFIGCATGLHATPWAARTPRYTLGYYNATAAGLRDVDARWHENNFDYHDTSGRLAPGSTSLTSEAPDPIPRRVTLSWRTHDGKSHEQTLDVATHVPDIEHFDGTIFFRIADTGVELVPLTNKQIEDLTDQGKKYP